MAVKMMIEVKDEIEPRREKQMQHRDKKSNNLCYGDDEGEKMTE